jgi:hypothetical protein
VLRSVLSTGILLVAGTAFVLLVRQYLNNTNGPPVVIVVPKGYTGRIWIENDPNAPEIPRVNEAYRVVIPPDGALRVRSLEPFQKWHVETAWYDDGSPLREVAPHELHEIKEDTVVLIALGSGALVSKDGQEYSRVEYFVGTAKQHREALQNDPLNKRLATK